MVNDKILSIPTLIVLTLFLFSFSSALTPSQWDYTPEGNITNIFENNTYINQTVELNTTQFETGEPVTIKLSWLDSFINNLINLFWNTESSKYYNTTQVDDLISNVSVEVNSTGLIKDWNESGYIKNWNASGWIIDWNSTGLILNWSEIIISTEYTHLSNFTDDLGYVNYTKLSELDNDLGIGNFSDWDKDYNDLINTPENLSEFTDDLGNRGYTHLSNFTNDGNFTTNVSALAYINSSGLIINWSGVGNTDTLYYAEGIYIYKNDSNYFILNETKLNETIQSLDTDTTYSNLSEFVNDVGFTTNESALDYVNSTGLIINWSGIGNTDTTYTAGSNLSLDGTVFSLNSTGILEWLNNVYCKLTGCEMKGNININQNNITNATYIQTQVINFSGGIVYYNGTDNIWDFS